KPDIIIYRAERFTEKGNITQYKKIFNNGYIFEDQDKKLIYEILIKDSRLNSLWIKAIKLKCFNNDLVSSFPPISMGDDVLYALEPITNANNIKYIEDILYNYRIISSSMTRNFQVNVYSGF